MRRGAGAAAQADAENQFRRLYAEHGRAVLAYAVRRTKDAADAAEVVADTFLVAWRRLTDIPPSEEARLWLYGVARRTLANQRRAERRRERLAERLRRELPVQVAAAGPVASPAGDAAMLALGALEEADREILLLTAWEQLEPAEIATMLGISRTAARSRLHRARARLRAELGESGHEVAAGEPVQCKEAR